MNISEEARRMAGGSRGPGVARAMEILTALGAVFEARELLPVRSVQVAGVSYGNLGEEGLAFLEELAATGARAVVPATLNPAGMDLLDPGPMGLDPGFVSRQRRVVAAYRKLGIAASCTCTPYLAGNLPAPGETLAWSESSAVTYVNSVLGARTNREGGPSALASALTGLTPAYGLHLDEARRPTLRVRLRAPLAGTLRWGMVGKLAGEASGGGVVHISLEGTAHGQGGHHGPPPTLAELKALSAALPTYGGAPMFHIAGVTPEAGEHPLPGEEVVITREALDEACAAHRGSGTPDLVCLGCPHASIDELMDMAAELAGRRVRIPLWICTSRPVKALADDLAVTAALEASGATVLCDTCFVVAPLDQSVRRVATDSAKGVYYLQGHGRRSTMLLSRAECLEGAVTGRFH